MYKRSSTHAPVLVSRQNVFLLLVVAMSALSLCSGFKLCKRCERSELIALRSYYHNSEFSQSVSFRQFISSLLRAMSNHKHMSDLYVQLKKQIHRYDDCLITCGISFTKRSDDEDFETYELLFELKHLYPEV